MRTADGYIINKCLNGDTAAFGLLVDKYKEGVYALAYFKLRNFHDADDVTQEVFIKAYQKLRTLRRWDNFHAWLYSMTSNYCKDWIRARSRRPDREFIEDQAPKAVKTALINSNGREAALELLDEALDSLPEMYRQVLTLYYLSGMNSREIAEFLRTSPATIRQRLSRARSQLKEGMLAMMSTAFEEQKLRAGFTFRIVEAVKRVKIQPTPRTAGLPWGISLATGIIIAVLSIGSHLNLPDLMPYPMSSAHTSEMAVTEVDEMPVEMLRISQIPVFSGMQGDDYGGGFQFPERHNAVLLAPRGEGDEWPEKPTVSLGKGTIHNIAYSPDGKLLAVAGGTGIWLYSVADLAEVGLLKGHTSPVRCVAFSPDGKLLASGGAYSDRTVRLWDVETQSEIAVLRGHTNEVNSVSFSPDGKLLASASWDETICLWDVAGQKKVATLSGHTNSVSSVSFSPDGELVASASRDKTIRFWDVALQKEAAMLEGHVGSVSSISFSPDGKLLASTSGEVRIWDVAKREQIDTLPVQWIYSVSFSPDGSLLALGAGIDDGRIWLWGLETNKEIAVLTGHTGSVRLSFGPNGKFLASLGAWRENTVRLWDLEMLEEIAVIRGYTEPMYSLAFSPDGKLLVSGSWSGPVLLWDMEEQKEAALLSNDGGVQSVSFSPDSELLAVGKRDRAIHIWDVRTKKESAVLEGHTGWVESVSFSPDGKLLASAGRDNTVRLWDMEKQMPAGILEGHTKWVSSVSFSPDGKLLASGSEDKTVRIWDMAKHTTIAVLKGHTGEVYSVSFSPDGTLVASSGSWDKTVRIWDVERKISVAVLHGHTDMVLSVAFSPDGKWIASGSGSGDRAVRLWDVDGRKQVAALKGHSDAVWSVAFSPNGRWLASASKDGTVLLWEVNLDIPGKSVEPAGKQLVTWGKMKKTELFQNFPNPFNPETSIPYSLSKSEHVTIRIYTSTGQLVRTLDLGQRPSGAYLTKEKAAYWDGKNEAGEMVASNIYFYVMEAGETTDSRKMVVSR